MVRGTPKCKKGQTFITQNFEGHFEKGPGHKRKKVGAVYIEAKERICGTSKAVDGRIPLHTDSQPV